MAPNGKQVMVSIAAPKIDGAYDVPPIPSGEDPAGYIANAISLAGLHRAIVFPKGGIYNFSSAGCQTGGAHLKLNAATDVVIDGNGSVLNFLAPCLGVAFINPTHVVLKNFTIDWPTLQIASLGTIVASGGTGQRRFNYGLQIDRQYVTGAMPRSYKSINAWDAGHGYWSLQHPDHEVGYNPRQPLSETGAAKDVQSWGAHFAPGERVLVRHYTTEGDAIAIYHGQDVTLQNITIYASPVSGSPSCKALPGSRFRTARSREQTGDRYRPRPTRCTSTIRWETFSLRTARLLTRATTASTSTPRCFRWSPAAAMRSRCRRTTPASGGVIGLRCSPRR
jgi:hypothetical protein